MLQSWPRDHLPTVLLSFHPVQEIQPGETHEEQAYATVPVSAQYTVVYSTYVHGLWILRLRTLESDYLSSIRKIP